MNAERKLIFTVRKNLIDDFFDILNKDNAGAQKETWRDLEILVSDDHGAADALRHGLTPGRLKIIENALKCDDPEIIRSAILIKGALLKSHERNEGVSLEVFAQKNEDRANRDRIERRAKDVPQGSKKEKKKPAAKVMPMNKRV